MLMNDEILVPHTRVGGGGSGEGSGGGEGTGDGGRAAGVAGGEGSGTGGLAALAAPTAELAALESTVEELKASVRRLERDLELERAGMWGSVTNKLG